MMARSWRMFPVNRRRLDRVTTNEMTLPGAAVGRGRNGRPRGRKH